MSTYLVEGDNTELKSKCPRKFWNSGENSFLQFSLLLPITTKSGYNSVYNYGHADNSRRNSIRSLGMAISISMYALTSSGDLLVSDTNGSDLQGKFRCQVTHQLTGEIRHSNGAQLHITEPERNEPPKLVYASPPTLRVRVDEEARIGCVAQGNPPPSY
ncbi:unnamed protein product, partial [Allacma fusca]